MRTENVLQQFRIVYFDHVNKKIILKNNKESFDLNVINEFDELFKRFKRGDHITLRCIGNKIKIVELELLKFFIR